MAHSERNIQGSAVSEERTGKPQIIIIVVGIIIWMLISYYVPLLHYSLDNYRYVFSAVLQSIAGIFALIVTVTLLTHQLSSNKAPTNDEALPHIFRRASGISVVLIFGLGQLEQQG